MGFPSVCSGIEMPKPLSDLLDLVAHIKLMIRLALFYLGLFDPTDISHNWDNHSNQHLPSDASPAITLESVKTSLPIVEFSDFIERSGWGGDQDQEATCAVCLACVEVGHEIRELSNCAHVFHVGCLDKWVDQGQVTCPLCRAKLLPEGEERKHGKDSWVVERIAYLFGEDLVRNVN